MASWLTAACTVVAVCRSLELVQESSGLIWGRNGERHLDDREKSPKGASTPGQPEDRLDSWKKIASYLKRDVSTVQRWEKREAMPVHRHLHDKLGSVFAYRSELDAWWTSRRARLAQESPSDNESPGQILQTVEDGLLATARRRLANRPMRLGIAAGIMLVAGAL